MAGEILVMTANGWLQIATMLAIVFALTKPIGAFMARVFSGEKTFLDPALRPLERLLYRCTGIDETREMEWKEYTIAMILFSGVSMLLLYGIERLQHWLPWNPQNLSGMAPSLAFGEAASFTSNTNWQSYVPETTVSYFTQAAGYGYHNFVSAAVGIVTAVALIRGISRRESKTVGNFWVDLTRCTLWLMLPICLAGSLVLVSQGVVQNFRSYQKAKLADPQTVQFREADGKSTTQAITEQVIAEGPVASQEVIKELGTNGGGFFNANSAHPFENPTPFTDLFEMVLFLVIPSGLTYALGRMTGSSRHGWALWSAMAFLFVGGITATYFSESHGNPFFHGVDARARAGQPGGNMEGKEVRFGVANSALWATETTATSCGAVNSMHDSFLPLGGMVALVNIMLGEVVFGGVGSGLYGMIVFAIKAVFIAGLMVGRTPEYLGKKIEAFDVKMVVLSVLISSLTILVFSAVAVDSKLGLAGITNPGPHGLSQILYAYSSAAGNNGSAFAGIDANTPWYNTSIGFCMLLGRFIEVVPIMAIAGSLAAKKIVPESAGTFPVTTPLFTFLLISVVVILGALTFFPALSLGPVLEELLMRAGRVF
jgi:K+-transporting ATPase ATPase A chain